MNKPKVLTRWEALALAVVIAGLIVWLLIPKGEGASAEIVSQGQVVGTYPLKSPARVRVNGAHGLELTAVIEEGGVRVEEAACPDLVCQHHAPISKAGESIVCLPAQVVITVKGGSGHGPDAVSG